LYCLPRPPRGSETWGRCLRFKVYGVPCTARCGTSQYPHTRQNGGSLIHRQVLPGGKRAVCKLPYAQGGVAGRALQIYRPPHSNRAARASLSLLRPPPGNHLIPEDRWQCPNCKDSNSKESPALRRGESSPQATSIDGRHGLTARPP